MIFCLTQPYNPLERWITNHCWPVGEGQPGGDTGLLPSPAQHQPAQTWGKVCSQGLPSRAPNPRHEPGEPSSTQIPTFCPRSGTLQADPSRGLLWVSPRTPFTASLGTGVSSPWGQIVFQSKFQRDYTTPASNRSEPALPSPALLLKKGEQGPRRLQNKLQSCQLGVTKFRKDFTLAWNSRTCGSGSTGSRGSGEGGGRMGVRGAGGPTDTGKEVGHPQRPPGAR